MISRIRVTAASMTFSSRVPVGEKTIFFVWSSCAVSPMLSEWSLMRSRSLIVCRYFDTSAVWRGVSSLLVILMR